MYEKLEELTPKRVGTVTTIWYTQCTAQVMVNKRLYRT